MVVSETATETPKEPQKMYLAELVKSLSQRARFSPSRAQNLKTSIRYLNRALALTPEPPTDASTLTRTYKPILRDYFATLTPKPSTHTVRNTFNNLSFLFRTSREQGLIETFIPRHVQRKMSKDFVREANAESPYRFKTGGHLSRYTLPLTDWPVDIRDRWATFRNLRTFEVRPISLKMYERTLNSYVSYGLTADEVPLTNWDQLFDIARLTRYIRWHAQRVGAPRITTTSVKVVTVVLMIARRTQHPMTDQLARFNAKLPTPETMHNKQHPMHTISLKEIEDVGLTILQEARTPLVVHHNRPGKTDGVDRATKHGFALMFRLWARVPLRIRNICEFRIDRNLIPDAEHTWMIHFQGEELKIATRRGRSNVYQVPFPADLLEHLDEYL